MSFIQGLLEHLSNSCKYEDSAIVFLARVNHVNWEKDGTNSGCT